MRDLRQLSAVGQFLQGIGTRCVEQAIAPRCAVRLGGNQRLHHELLQGLDDAILRHLRPGRDCYRAPQREVTCEDGEALKYDPLALADQTETPVERSAERLLPRRRRPPPAPFELQPVVEQRRHLAQSIETDTCGSQLDRQRDAVELAANPGQDFGILVGDVVAMPRRDGAIDEQAHGGISKHLAGTEAGALRRTGERNELENLLAFHQQRLAAGCEDDDARRLPVDVFCKARDLLDDVLAAVEHEKQPAAAQEIDDAGRGVLVVHDEAQRGCNRARDQRSVLERTEFEEMDVAVEAIAHLVRERSRNGGLSDAARPSQRDEAIAEQARCQLGHGVLSPDHPVQSAR
ncbi:hypothetical protein ACVWZL_005197 [Bradyrhizobium sp. GM2.4]